MTVASSPSTGLMAQTGRPSPSCRRSRCYTTANGTAPDRTLNLEGGRLPQDDGGFESFYRAYGTDWQTESFVSTIALLHDGQWHGSRSDVEPGGGPPAAG